jgi:hypothetical protein
MRVVSITLAGASEELFDPGLLDDEDRLEVDMQAGHHRPPVAAVECPDLGLPKTRGSSIQP